MNIIKKLIGSSSPSSSHHHHHQHNESTKQHTTKVSLSNHATTPAAAHGSGSHHVSSTSTSKVIGSGAPLSATHNSYNKNSVTSLQGLAAQQQNAGVGIINNNGQSSHLQSEQQQRLSIDRSRFWDSRLLIFHMIVRAKADEIATLQGNKGVDKLKMIAIMWRKIKKDPGLVEQLIRHGLLRACLVWLSPYPDGQIQSQQVQMRVMDLLQSIKLDINDIMLVGLDLTVFLLYGSRQQNQRADDLARNLLIKWYLSDKNLSKDILGNPERVNKIIRHEVAKRLQKTGINPPLLPEQTLRSYTANLQIGPQDLDTESLSSASRKSSVSSQSAPHSRRNTKSSPKPIPGKGGDTGGGGVSGGGGGGYSGNELDELNIPEYLEFTPQGELIEPDNGVFRSFPFFMRRFLKVCRLKVFRQAKEDVLDENVND